LGKEERGASGEKAIEDSFAILVSFSKKKWFGIEAGNGDPT
jgi:hypothetical protein